MPLANIIDDLDNHQGASTALLTVVLILVEAVVPVELQPAHGCP